MDRETFVRRVTEMESRLYRIACSQLREPADREDAVQEAVLRAWQGRNRLREERYFETWLIRILINECHNIHRLRRRMVPVDEAPEPKQEIHMPERDEGVREAIWRLPEKLKLPVVLYYIEGYDTKEIAQILVLPKGTVCGRLRRAREALKEFLTEDEGWE